MHYYILHGGEISQNRNQISTNKYQAKEDTLLLKSNMLHTCSFMRSTRFSTVTLTFDYSIGQVELSWVYDVISHLICIFIDFFYLNVSGTDAYKWKTASLFVFFIHGILYNPPKQSNYLSLEHANCFLCTADLGYSVATQLHCWHQLHFELISSKLSVPAANNGTAARMLL